MAQPKRTEAKRTEEDIIRASGGGIGLLIATFLLFKQLNDLVTDFRKTAFTAPLIVWIIFLVILTIRACVNIKKGLAQRSHLNRPEALLLKPDRHEHLIGRESDVDKLYELCRNHLQIHLIGPSGVGKSAILQAGLIPKLKQDGMLAIYISSWREDWETGPCEALAEALWNVLSAAQKQDLQIDKKPRNDEVLSILRSCQETLRVMPFVMFDQFDDYQTLHYASFLSSNEAGTLLSVQDLTHKNNFWHEICSMLEKRQIKVLFAVRDDAQQGLKTVAFVNTMTYRLTSVESNYFHELLNRFSNLPPDGEPIISNPTRGWNQLAERLIKDLGANYNDTISPIRLSFAMEGIQKLPVLAVPEYEMAGQIRGLYAASINIMVMNIAQKTGLDITKVVSILKTLVVLSSDQKIKSVPRSFDYIDRSIGEDNAEKIDPSFFKRDLLTCLEEFEHYHVVRKIITPNTCELVWVLDGDYLCQAVLDAGEYSNRWFNTLQQHVNLFRDPKSNPIRRWWTLLSPSQTIVFIYHRLKGELEFKKLRGYLFLSMLRFIPYTLPAIILLYLAVAEANWKLPGAEFTRDYLYYHRISLFKHIYQETEIQRQASQIRKELIDTINIRNKNGWITQAGENEHSVKEAWIQGEACCAVLSAPESASVHIKYQQYLDTLFHSENLIPGYGWLRDETSDYTIAEPVLWTIAARSILHSTLINADQSSNSTFLEAAQKAAGIYYVHSPDQKPGGWNMFPNQKALGLHSTYTTTLALLALLEENKQKLFWREQPDGPDISDKMLKETATWLMDCYHKEVPNVGWSASTDDLQIQEGLNFQIYAELLRAHLETGLTITPAIIQEIPRQLEVLETRKYGYTPLGYKDWVGTKFTNHAKKMITVKVFKFRYAWYPWSISCAIWWLKNAETDPKINWRDVAKVRRVRDHLIMDLAQIASDNFKQQTTYTFQGSELLYALAAIPVLEDEAGKTQGSDNSVKSDESDESTNSDQHKVSKKSDKNNRRKTTDKTNGRKRVGQPVSTDHKQKEVK